MRSLTLVLSVTPNVTMNNMSEIITINVIISITINANMFECYSSCSYYSYDPREEEPWAHPGVRRG